MQGPHEDTEVVDEAVEERPTEERKAQQGHDRMRRHQQDRMIRPAEDRDDRND